MNHTSAMAGVWFYTRYCLTTNTKMKTRQRNPPQGMTMPRHMETNNVTHQNECRTKPAEPRSETRPDHTPATAVNRQATAPLPLKWPATSPPSPDEEAEGTTHPLGRTVPHLLEQDGTTHPPKQDGTTHLPMWDSTTHPPMRVWCY
ncbi:hypothetical protein BS47DRAFT_1367615 [Hydnum rufescens UP504]|uniref:Uncharacterized protein n=1 Tax=Hydnum rufescens UP504 TaxID=1448309 RepID=A0A9P6DLP4_9AGAM|nr:hypothetical protein BS47DRAFT_1367615 [Hydnum rufescens UP504]